MKVVWEGKPASCGDDDDSNDDDDDDGDNVGVSV